MRSKLRVPFYLLLAVFLLPPLFAAVPAGKAIARPALCTIYVNGNPDMGDDGWDGSVPVRIPDTLMGPKHSIQMGIDAVCDDGTGTVNIAAGTYSLTGDNHVWISKPLNLTGAGAAGTIIEGSRLEDWEVVSVAHTTVGTVNISNLTITGGPTWGGVWIYADNGTTNFSSCTITGNYACNYEDSSGGGIFVLPGNTVNMTNCTISGNHAGLCLTEQGHASGASHPALATDADSYIYDGSAGGIYIEGSTLTMNGCKLFDNTATGNINPPYPAPETATVYGMDVSGSGGGLVAMDSTVNMTGCTISGNSASGTGADVSGSGGGIVAINTPLTMTGCTVSGNSASGGGGTYLSGSGMNGTAGVLPDYAFYAAGSGGGIVAIESPLTMTGCTVQGNLASNAVTVPAAVSEPPRSFGYDVSGSGGGIVAMGPLTMSNCTVRNNTATGDLGIPVAPGENAPGGIGGIGFSGSGGGLVSLFYPFKINNNSVFDNNTATGLGGGIVYLSDIFTVDQPAAGQGSNRLQWQSGRSLGVSRPLSTAIASAEMNDFTLTNNKSDTFGGGLFQIGSTLTLNRGTISHNQAGDEYGGIGSSPIVALGSQGQANPGGNTRGLFGVPTAGLTGPRTPSPSQLQSLTLNDCTIDHNAAGWGPGGVAGAYYTSLTMTGCTVSNNTAGEICSGVGISSFSTGNLTNCTIFGNSIIGTMPDGVTDLGGAGVVNILESQMELLNTTIANNTTVPVANTSGGGFFSSENCATTFKNCIVANNTASMAGTNNCFTSDNATPTSLGHNIDSLNECGFTAAGDQINTNPLLGPLQNNGGPTFTCAIGTNSPAFNRGDNNDAPATDQRGVARPQATYCTIGAYEVNLNKSATTAVATGQGNATFATSGGGITDLQAYNQLNCLGGQGIGASQYIFPFGCFSFKIVGLAPGAKATITITLPSSISQGAVYYKCINGQLVDCTSLLGSNDGDNILTLTISDGGLGDADGLANGTIIDPGGPAIMRAAPLASHSASIVTPPSAPILLSNLVVQSASLSPKAVTPGTPVTVTADIANKSAVNGNKKVTLYVNGQAETTQGVTVNSGGSSKLTFNVSRSEPGDYNVYVDGVPAGSFKVELFRESDGILILSATLVALAFLIGIVMLWRRQRTGIN